MRKLLLIPPLSAAIITALVAYRLNRPEPVRTPASPNAVEARPVPLFQLYDEQSQLVRVQRYVGRHKLLIVFFDGSRGPDGSALLATLRGGFQPIHDTGAIVLALSTLRPSELRPPLTDKGERTRRADPFPFPMLADINDAEVHRQFGAWDDASGKPREGVFVVDRAGMIRLAHLGPDDLGAPEQWAAELRTVR